ncbi:flippase [Candidatus Woesearchaeota archaeon]|nr:flippase [Candidatus Woesearchaeota archaeon]
MEKHSLVSRLIIVYAIAFLAAPIGYVQRVLYSRSLSVEEYGTFYGLVALITMIMIFTDFGMSRSLAHHLPKYLKSPRNLSPYIWSALLFNACTSAIIFLVMYLLRERIATLYATSVEIVLLMGVSIFLYSLAKMIIAIYEGHALEKYYSSYNGVRMLIVVVASAGAFILGFQDLLRAFVWIWIVSIIIANIIYILPLHRIVRNLFSISVTKKSFGELFAYAKFVVLDSAAFIFINKIDSVMIAFFLGMTYVGYYEAALPLLTLLFMSITPFQMFLFPTVSKLHHEKDITTTRTILTLIYRTLLFFFLPAAAVLALYPREMILLFFGENFLPAATVVQILSCAALFKLIYSTNYQILDGIGLVKQKSYITYSSAALNICLNLILIPLFAIEGAAMSTLITYAFMGGATLWLMKRGLGFVPPVRHLTLMLVNVAAFVAVVTALKTYLDLQIYVEAVVVVGSAGALYLIAGYLLKLFDVQFIINFVKNKFAEKTK